MGDLAEEEVNRIMAIADSDGSGEIDYSEWLMASVDKKKLLSKENLEIAFNLFDKDKGGSISADEVKQMFGIGKHIDENVWDDIVKEVDANGDGEVSFEEFKLMMEKILF